jgi:hypothetical protein
MVDAINAMALGVYELPCPVVGAITGHTDAGVPGAGTLYGPAHRLSGRASDQAVREEGGQAGCAS